MNDMLAASRNVRHTLTKALTLEIHREQNLLRSALENHSSVPDHYWQERHRLTRMVEAINAIVEVLEEERHG